MIEQIKSYIAAVEANIEEYKQIENVDERERALKAAYGMKADFEDILENMS